MNPLFAQQPTSIFAHMSMLAAEHQAINLGQGFPDFGWPDDVVLRAADALRTGSNQYAPMRGLPELRQAVVHHYARHQGVDYELEEVTITSGATEALASAIMALVSPGDEVLLFQPLYDAYVPLVRRAGGVPRFVRLEPPDWRITREKIEEVLSPRTRLVIFNNPHNPTARLFGESELKAVADICVERDLIAITDEVWEHILFDGGRMVPLASLPGMRERTVKIGSAGKIFSLTGWKVGWIAAAPELAAVAARAHQFLTFSTAPNLQSAVAFGMAEGDSWIEPMRDRFARARDRLVDGLQSAGYATLHPASTYFLCVDLAASGIAMDDEAFAAAAVEQAGVAVVPVSAFAEQDPPRHIVRLCFSKRDETLDAGIAAMAKARELFA